jgi:hypothetical protein
MTFKLSNADHKNLDGFIDRYFEAYRAGKITLSQARDAIAHVVTAGVIDHEAEFKQWLGHTPEEGFKDAQRP